MSTASEQALATAVVGAGIQNGYPTGKIVERNLRHASTMH